MEGVNIAKAWVYAMLLDLSLHMIFEAANRDIVVLAIWGENLGLSRVTWERSGFVPRILA